MKTKKAVFLVFTVIVGYILFRYYVSIHQTQINLNNFMQAENVVSPTPLPSPTPTPVTIDSNSNLKGETEKLVPTDFSSDFNSLKERASKF